MSIHSVIHRDSLIKTQVCASMGPGTLALEAVEEKRLREGFR
jgi:hypothetical protein